MTGQRIDKWLWFARCCKTRMLAQHLVEHGMVTVNGKLVGKSSLVAVGDEVALPVHPHDPARGLRRLRVLTLGERRGPAAEARAFYADAGTGAGARQDPEGARVVTGKEV